MVLVFVRVVWRLVLMGWLMVLFVLGCLVLFLFVFWI